MFIRDILSQKRYLPVKLAIVAVIASFIAVLSFHISRSSGVSTFNGTVTNDTDVVGNTGSQKKMSYVSVTIQQNDSLWSIAKKYKNQYDGSFNDFLEEIKRCNGLSSDTIYAGNHIIVPVVIHSEKIEHPYNS